MTSSSSSARTSPSPSTPPPSIALAAGGLNSALKQRTGLFRDPAAAPTIRTTVKQRARQNTISDDDFVRNLGADYQDVEKRTLTRWVNAQLSTVGDRIDRIETDLKDGKRLLKLLSVVSDQAAPKPERMNMRIHQLANVAQAFGFLERQLGAEAMPDIGNEAIVNGDMKKTLALVFFIMLKYQIQAVLTDHGEDFKTSLSQLSERHSREELVAATESEETVPATPRPSGRRGAASAATDKGAHTTSEAKVALLYWVRIQLEDYIAANIIPSVQDFSRSWRTGLAFCLLLHRHDPVLIPDLLTTRIHAGDMSEKQTWRELLELAFNVANTQLNIPNYLDPEDLIDVEYPHEPSVMMYVSEYYKVMSKVQRNESTASRRDKRTKRRAAIAMAVGEMPEEEEEEEEDEEEEDPVFCDTPPSMDEEMEEEPPSPQDEKHPNKEYHIKPINVVSAKAPLEAPVPVPMPSARRNRRKPPHQRESTLGEEDKARIKADLNSRLMMQLTGHLPRGVNPTLDQLITIHETVISFIRTNTRTMDEIPDEFTSSSTVTEYVDALEIIEEQTDSEAEHLDTAKAARDSLMSSPEKAEDTLIRLTDLQRGQVDKLYDVLNREWKEFVDLLQSTKADLLRLENDLIETEERVAEYEQQAAKVESELSDLLDMVARVPPQDESGRMLHPLDGSEATSLDGYSESVSNAVAQIKVFDTSTWKEYRAYLRELLPAVRQAVSQRHASVERKYEMLETTMRKAKRRFSLFRRGMTFGKVLRTLETELTDIQKTMDEKQKSMTDDAIMDLENRVSMVRSKLNGAREEYDDLFEEDTDDKQGFEDRFSQVQKRYREVGDWVDQVRVWFIEAGRIRNWIEARIATLQERTVIDPLSTDFALIESHATRLHREHEHLKREVERFDADDMSRLRTHVKKLTVGGDHKLSPADASTIEITLQTLNMLNKLTTSLRKRSDMVDMVMLRVKWHELFTKASDWISTTNQDATVFLTGLARWSRDRKVKADAVIQTLVGLEKRIAEFDQGLYSQVLDACQELEDLYGKTLPDHLEQVQSSFEQTFADLMKRSAFCRKVVEQHLVTADVAAQFEHLKTEGEKLRQEMMSQEEPLDDRVQVFKESSAYLMTEVASSKIPYPEEAPEGDVARNNKANESIRKAIEEYGTELVEIAEGLDELLAGHRQNMSLQERAKYVYDEMVRLTAWIDERIRSLQKSHPFELVTSLDEEPDIETLDRLENERQGTSARVHQIDENDYPKLLESMRLVEDEIDATNAVAIDRNTLINAVESLEQSHSKLVELLQVREHDLLQCRKHVEWMSEWDSLEESIIVAAHDIWSFTIKKAKFDPGREDTADISVKEQDMSSILQSFTDRVAEIDQKAHRLDDLHHELVSQASNELLSAINTKQGEVQAKHAELSSVLSYAGSAVEQRLSLTGWLAQLDEAQKQGHYVRDEFERRQHDVDDEPVLNFKRLARSVYETTISNTKVPDGFGERLQWDFEAINPQDYHARVQAQIEALIESKTNDLKQVEREIDQLYSAHQNTGKLRQLVNLYDAEIVELRQWFAEHVQQLKHQHIDALAEITADELAERQAKHDQLTADIKQFEKANIQSLCDNIAQLSAQFHQQDGIDVAGVEQRLDEVLVDMEELKSMLVDQSVAFDAAEKRVQWEAQYTAASTLLKGFNEQLREVTKQRDATSTDANNLGDRVRAWREELADLEKNKGRFAKHDLKSVEATYRDLGRALMKCNRSTTVIPADIDARMDSLQRIEQRLTENLHTRLDELSTINKRIDWQYAVDAVLEKLADHEHSLETFVQDDAQWTPEMPIQENDEQRLRDQCAQLVSKFETFQTQRLVPLRSELEALEGPLPEPTLSRAQELDKAEAQLTSHFKFANEVVTQHCLVSAFILRTDQLEQTAELIREEFLTEVNAERLEQFKSSVDDVRNNLVRQIRYPVRSITDDSVKTEIRIQDESVNEVVRDTIDTRTSRLDELVASMQFQLESKVTISRFQVQLHLYKRHAEACSQWIDKHREAVQQSQQLLDQGTERVLTMGELQQAIGAVRGTERAMLKVKDNVFTSLETRFEQCVNAFDDTKATEEEEKALADDFDSIAESQNTISDEWHQLRDDVSRMVIVLTDVLEPTEKHHRAQTLVESLTALQSSITESDLATLTDEQILQWQKRVDTLDANDYRTLQSETPTFPEGEPLVKTPMAAAQAHLETAGDMMLDIRASLASLYDTVNINRLRNTYSDNASVARNMMTSVQGMFKDACENFQIVTAKERVSQRQAILSAHKEAQHQLSECKDAYDDLCGYYEFIKTQEGLGDELDDLHVQVQEEWQAIQAEQSALATRVAKTDKWVERYDILDKLQQSLSTTRRDLEEKRNIKSYSSSTTSSSNKSRSSSNDSEASLLATLDKRLNAATRDLDDLKSSAESESKDDSINHTAFVDEWDMVIAKVASLKSSLSSRKFEHDKAHLLSAFTDELKRQCTACEEQITFLKQQTSSNPTIAEKKPTAIQGVIQAYSAALSNIHQVHGRCKTNLEHGLLAEQADALVDTYNFLKSEVERLKRPLMKAIADLEQKMTVEDEYVIMLKSVCRHAEAEADTMSSLNDFKATVARFSRSARIARTKGSLLPDLNEFERRYQAMEDTVGEFYAAGNKVKSNTLRDRIGGSRIASINRTVDRRQDTIRREWARIKSSADETKVKLQETQLRQHASGKLSEAMRYVSDLKHRVNTLQLSGKSFLVEQQELQEIQEDMDNTLVKKIRDLDGLLASVSDKDGKLKRQRQELNLAIDELRKLVEERQKEAEMEGNITLFVDIIDKMDEQISELFKLIDSCAPRHAPVVQNKFNKSDLQRLLRRLMTGYKTQAPKIAELVETAKSEARKQFVDNERVAEKLDKTLEKWIKVQTEAHACEKELQACIKQLDHEFFTKLAMAKSTSPTGKGQSEAKRRQQRTPTPPIIKQRPGARRASFRSSNLAVDNGRTARSRTPTASTSRGKSYVSDPKNELDVHLGKIVNESPYRMKVKMVSGEVGKYWFGEEQPRLVYCRILSSKTVMVRVGGGWLELSTFLKNHGQSESNAAARSHPSDKTNESVDSDISSLRSASPSSRVALRGGGRSPSISSGRPGNRSPVPPTSTSRGYVDGDKYVRVDDEGKQVAVKMSKAQDTARTPASKSRFT